MDLLNVLNVVLVAIAMVIFAEVIGFFLLK